MVDLQLIGVLVTAASVTVAMVFYTLNLRETIKNRRANLTHLISEPFSSVDGFKRLLQLYYMEWTDFNDYMKKYDSTVNPDNAAIRHNVWDSFTIMGYQWRAGILDKETIYKVVGNHISTLWVKFKPIIEEYRKRELGEDAYSEWEYLAQEIAKISARRAPSFRSQAYTKQGEYEKTYGLTSSTP